jgi:hypothetical protein
MELIFIDKSPNRFVAQHLCFLVTIDDDYIHPGMFRFSIYEDTIEALGGKLLECTDNIHWLPEAKKRATNKVEALASKLRLWQGK